MKIAIANDHAAVEMKNEIAEYLRELGHEVTDYGTNSTDPTNYPVYGEKVAHVVANKEVDYGVLICGTGVGISMVANKVNGIRAAVCSESTTARLVRSHNDANIIAFGSRIISVDVAKDIVRTFLATDFMGGRHQTRLDMIRDLEARR